MHLNLSAALAMLKTVTCMHAFGTHAQGTVTLQLFLASHLELMVAGHTFPSL